MKRMEDLNYYEILEIAPEADDTEVRIAYLKAKKALKSDSIVHYFLLNEEEIKELQVKIEIAYQALKDEEKRRRYNESLYKNIMEDKEIILNNKNAKEEENTDEILLPIEGKCEGEKDGNIALDRISIKKSKKRKIGRKIISYLERGIIIFSLFYISYLLFLIIQAIIRN